MHFRIPQCLKACPICSVASIACAISRDTLSELCWLTLFQTGCPQGHISCREEGRTRCILLYSWEDTMTLLSAHRMKIAALVQWFVVSTAQACRRSNQERNQSTQQRNPAAQPGPAQRTPPNPWISLSNLIRTMNRSTLPGTNVSRATVSGIN